MEKEINDTNKSNQSDNLKNIYIEFMNIFNVNTEEKLVKHLSKINIASNEVCAKVLKGGVGAWECSDCGRDSRCVMCNDCYEKSKDKHVNHKKKFKNTVSGCCDCGDPDAWDPSGFCSEHGGIITSEDEINDLINKAFDQITLHKIYKVLDRLFQATSNLIALYEKEDDYDQLQKLAEPICSVIKNLHEIVVANNAMLFIIVNYFMKNFPFETEHTCFSVDKDFKIIQKIDFEGAELPENMHVCNCYFLQNFIRICDENFDKLKLDKIFMPFLKSYKFKYLYSFSYISLYKEIILNGSKYIEQFSVQVLTNEDVGLAIASNEQLMNSLFWSLHFLSNRYLDQEDDLENMNDKEFYEIVFRFYIDIFYLCKPRPTGKISQYVRIIKISIDVLCTIQNKIKFKKATSFQYEGFRESFVTMEMYLLYLFSMLTTYFDFSNKKNADEILFYLIDKIRNINFQKLSEEEYSFHIPVNRALGIFLNRYAFYSSVEENIDFYMAVKNILYSYYVSIFSESSDVDVPKKNSQDYNFDQFLQDLVKDTIKTLGFINSIPCKLWVYYGENMLYYNYLYYSLDIFRLSDVSLLKLILSQDQTGNIFNIENFLNLSNINGSYTTFKTELFNNQTIQDFTGKNLFVKNLDILIRLYRNDSILLDLLMFSYDRLKENKCEDLLFQKLMSKEKNSLIEDVKIRLSHIIISKENSIYFSEINKVLPFYIKDFLNAEKIEEIINQICDRVTNKNKTVMFRLKEEYFSLIDLFYITNPQKEATAERYLLEFKKKDVCLLNTPHFNKFEFIKLVNANMANHFFRNDQNINLLLTITTNTLNKISSNELTANYSFILNFLKLIDIFVDACLNSGLLSKHESKFQNKELITALTCFKSSDDNLVSYVKKLLSRLMNLFSNNASVALPFANESDGMDLKKHLMKQRKEKMAEMYKSKGMEFRKNLGVGIENDIGNIPTSLSNESNTDININTTGENSKIISTFNSSLIDINTDKIIPSNMQNINQTSKDSNSLLKSGKISSENLPEENFDCVICRNKINAKEYLQNPFGRIGVFSKSNFIYHSKLQTLKEEYERNIINIKNTLSIINNSSNIKSTHLSHFQSLDHSEQIEMKELMLTYKRSKPELKNGIRYASCNHYLHFSCYLSYVMKYVVGNTDSKHLLFVCPLCKVSSNSYIPHFDYKKENSQNDILQGINFEELFVFYKEILSQNTTINHADLNFFNYRVDLKSTKFRLGEALLPSVSYFVEHIVSNQLKTSFLINDFKNKLNQEKYYDTMLNFFINSLSLVDGLCENDNLLDVLKDFILSLRILIKTENLDPQIFFNRLITIQFYWNTDFISEDNIVNNLENDKVSLLFFENLFLILILFEEKEFNYFNIIFRHFTPLIFVQFFLLQLYTSYNYKINSQIFRTQFQYENLMYLLISPEESRPLKKFLLFYLRKIYLLKNIFGNNKYEKFQSSNSSHSEIEQEFQFLINQLGLNIDLNKNSEKDIIINNNNLFFTNWLKLDETIYPQFWTFREDLKEHTLKIFNKYFNVKCKFLENEENSAGVSEEPSYDLVNPALLLISNNLNFHFISIPNNLLDLSMKYYKIVCNHCNTAPVYSLLCLTCGEKICYMENCCRNFGKKKNVYEYVWHNKICGNGDGVFLHVNSGEITFAFLGNFVNTKVSIYLNKYGESLKSRSITDDYLLNEELFKTILNEYKDLKYRKYLKINQRIYFMDVEEEELN